MPTPEAIVEGLRSIARNGIGLAVAWHVALFGASFALIVGWRPSQRAAAALLAAPVASVSAAAFVHGNAFNGIVFGALALVMLPLAARLAARPVARGGAGAAGIGIAMIAFGWLYPHFLDGRPSALYLVAAPTGLIPCPTLSTVIGFTLLAGGFGSNAWSMVLASAGLFYGIFGFGRLGVRIDLPLAVAAAALLAFAFRRGAWRLRREGASNA